MNKRDDRGYNVTRTSTRYTRGGISDVYNTRVGWWEKTILPEDPTDLFFDIDSETERRPDLIAYQIYGKASYAWVVLQFNNIIDVNEELLIDTTLKLPTPARLNTVLLTNTSGGRRIET